MTSASPALQFGIQVRGQRSYTWRIRSGAKNPELFVERENLPPTVHLSLHASGQWHMKVRRRREHQWPQAGGDHTRLHPCSGDRAAGDVAMFALPAPAGAHLLELPADAESTAFNVWIERPGANLQSWPGRNADGTVLVGRIPLAGGAGTCCVVSRQTAITPGSATLERPTDRQLTWMQDTAAKGRLYCTIIGDLDDKTLVLLDLRADPSLVRRG
jgi:hypothetical protein